jgi:lysophospholipase L1-like esterase
MFSLLLSMALMQTPVHVATTPASRMNEQWWAERHQRCVETTKAGGFDIAFLGDSITQGWEGPGAATWAKMYAPLKAANFGFSGDRTEHVLWRLGNGELVAAQPKVIVIMIGTNNSGHGVSNAQQTADGVAAIVRKLRKETPKSKILLLGIFPRGEKPDEPYRLAVVEATRLFAPLHDGKYVHFLDIGQTFMHQDGTLRTLLLPDRLHLDPMAYELWAKAIEPTLSQLLHH